jgi:hypothetical protein
MATFRAYAKVLEPDDPTMRIYEAGLRACPGEPGMPLAEVLRRSGGVYQTTTPLIPHMRDDIREVAELTSDAELLKIAEMTEVPVSLEHLRGLDPQTRIIIRSELSYEGDEASQVSAATRPRHALATVMPDGTVIPGDVRPLGRLDPHPPGDRLLGQVTTNVPGHIVAARPAEPVRQLSFQFRQIAVMVTVVTDRKPELLRAGRLAAQQGVCYQVLSKRRRSLTLIRHSYKLLRRALRLGRLFCLVRVVAAFT